MQGSMRKVLEFIGMDGLGNDFVIADARGVAGFALTTEQVRRLAARANPHTQGCDQVIVMEDAQGGAADCFMRIYNQDGSEVDACGNATRCVGWLLLAGEKCGKASIRTKAGLLEAALSEGKNVTVDMGAPHLNGQEIPLGWECDTLHLPVVVGALKDGVAVSMGNPHAVFFMEEDVDSVDLETLAPRVQQWEQGGKKLFPQGVNVGVVNVLSRTEIKLRVYERGVGETLACGTGACAAAVAAMRRGYTARSVVLHLRGGDLNVLWQENDAVLMTGAVNLRWRKKATLAEMLA